MRADWERRYSVTLGGLRWTDAAVKELKKAVKKHGERGWHNILTDPVFENLQQHSKEEIIQKWEELKDAEPKQTPFLDTSDPIALRATFGRTNPRLISSLETELSQTKRLQKQLMKERAARESAEMRVSSSAHVSPSVLNKICVTEFRRKRSFLRPKLSSSGYKNMKK